MTAINFAQHANIVPKYTVTYCTCLRPNSYVCHTAVLHWACLDLGLTEEMANLAMSHLTSLNCPGCISGNISPHICIPAAIYSGLFIQQGAVPLSAIPKATEVQVGDVIIVGDYHTPSHSMVVVRINIDTEQIFIRGYNNIGTFIIGPPAGNVYDPEDRDLATALSPGGGIFGANLISFFKVPYHFFSGKLLIWLRSHNFMR